MTKALEMNGPTRKTLASQLDRLDSTLDGLSEGLNQAVAQAVREAVGLAVREAVQAVLSEVLTNPALRGQLQKAASPDPAAGAELAPESGKGRFAELCSRVRAKLRSAGRAGVERLRRAGRAASIAWQLAGARVRAVLLAGAGVVAVATAYLARTSLAAAARRLGDGAKALAGRAWSALRRALPEPAACVT
jgi:hypothetical protein